MCLKRSSSRAHPSPRRQYTPLPSALSSFDEEFLNGTYLKLGYFLSVPASKRPDSSFPVPCIHTIKSPAFHANSLPHCSFSPSSCTPPLPPSLPLSAATTTTTSTTITATMQSRASNKTLKDPSPSSGKPTTTQTQTSSQTNIRSGASSHGAVFF